MERETAEANEVEDEQVRAVVCVACGHVVTDEREAIVVDGRALHQCINPQGTMFEIACYRSARGAVGVGPSEAYFSWFPGTAWRALVCGGCHVQLGWSFSGRPDGTFVGLITERVRET